MQHFKKDKKSILKFLKDLLNLSENKVTIDLIQTLVCKFFKISKNEMLSSCLLYTSDAADE